MESAVKKIKPVGKSETCFFQSNQTFQYSVKSIFLMKESFDSQNTILRPNSNLLWKIQLWAIWLGSKSWPHKSSVMLFQLSYGSHSWEYGHKFGILYGGNYNCIQTLEIFVHQKHWFNLTVKSMFPNPLPVHNLYL